MPRIALPDMPVNDQLRCEFEIEVAFNEVAEAAEFAGWDETIVALALKSLAKNYMFGREANAETDREIELALIECR